MTQYGPPEFPDGEFSPASKQSSELGSKSRLTDVCSPSIGPSAGLPTDVGQFDLASDPCLPSQEVVSKIETPALVFDQSELVSLLGLGLIAREKASVKVLYAIKALALLDVLEIFAPHLDGFAVSSPFEARLIKDSFPGAKTHFTSPGIRPKEFSELCTLCDFISANSLAQLKSFGSVIGSTKSLGIRVNTKVSYVSDCRYDPSRLGSKLGVTIDQVPQLLADSPTQVEGLHFHSNSDSENFHELLDNVVALINAIPKWQEVKWVNLGGGYLLEGVSLDPLVEAAELIRARFGAEVFIEPGAGLVRAAGYLIGSVLDTFEVDGKRIAVLDTTINHMPEVLEFDYQPDVVGHLDDGPFEYVIAGATCLAGDIFGTYRLPTPLEVGQRVVFREAGAYSLAKAHRFNGVNLPQVGILDPDGQYRVAKRFDYHDFASFWKSND